MTWVAKALPAARWQRHDRGCLRPFGSRGTARAGRARHRYRGASTQTARVGVNGQTVGIMALSDGWAEYAFNVPEDSLVVSLNTLTLLYSDTPRTLDPGFRGRNTSIALDWVHFEPKSAR